MARPIRFEFAGAIYHVTSRGDRREDIYDSDADREHFIKYWALSASALIGCVMPIA